MNVRFLILVLLSACANPSSHTQHDTTAANQSKDLNPNPLAEFQGDWEKLTRWPNGEWLVYRPCDADNPTLSFMPGGDHRKS